MTHPAIEAADAQLQAAGLPTYTELLGRSHDVAEGIEDMKNLPGSVPARLEKLKAALLRVFGQTKVKNDIGNPFALVDADAVAAAAFPDESARPSDVRSEVLQDFEVWWDKEGQYGRSGGGDYEKTFAFNAWVEVTSRVRRQAQADAMLPTAI